MLENDRAKEYYGYLCMMRPPYPGAVPKDGLEKIDFKEGRGRSGHFYWGRAVYSRKLSEEEVRHYDLEETTLATMD